MADLFRIAFVEMRCKKQWVRIWGVDGKAATMSDPDKVITLVSLLEHDYSDPNAVVTVSRALLFGNLLTHVSAGLSHDHDLVCTSCSRARRR